MRVIKFFTKKLDEEKIEPYVWYIEDSLRPSKILERIEEFLRRNHLICYMSSFVLFESVKEYEDSIKKELVSFKQKHIVE